MGQKIAQTHFTRDDFAEFRRRLKVETELLREWIRSGSLADEHPRMGLELEAWLVDGEGLPAPLNEQVLDRVSDPHIENELALYNLELNTGVYPLAGRPFSGLEAELAGRLGVAEAAAGEEGARIGLMGILPSLRESDLTVASMTPSPRYMALNEQVLALRNRQPLQLEIDGVEHLSTERFDVMLEAATTSLQLHIQVPPARAADYFNAAVVLSAATVGVAANSPFLFGRRLWEETRIPLFEQAVAVTALERDRAGPLARVGFGSGYGRDALYNFFVENRQHHPLLLPMLFDTPPEQLAHLRLHNGTIWRWNRPLVEVVEGRCHLRMEHRVMASGPTMRDVVANAAFFYGAVCDLAAEAAPMAERLPFHLAERNFYQAARYGLAAEVEWFGGQRGLLGALIQERLLPAARRGLARMGVAEGDAAPYLDVIAERTARGATGAAWQSAWVERHGRDMADLTLAYLERAATGEPVHRWPL